MAHGHMIPTVDMAKLFASRGLKTTIITTPLNSLLFSKTIERNKNFGINVDLRILKFPSVEAGLPEGCENVDSITPHENGGIHLIKNFLQATSMLQEPLEKLLQECHPDCLVADMFFPWATDAAAKFGIPRLVFHGTSFFSLCTRDCINQYQPHKKVSSDSEPFLVPYLPSEIKLTRKQLPETERQEDETDLTKLVKASIESESKSFGVLVNSFYELEPAYADYYRKVLGRRAWHIGPVSLCNRGIEDKAQRGKESSILVEIAIALEASRQQFIWVVRREKNNQEDEEQWLPEGFEERMEGKGLIIRGWAPQVLILDHEAIGGFVTHCGWNSTLEGITAGKPMVTWPVSAEQFYNEKLVIEVLKIGIGVGVKEWVKWHGDHVEAKL
ncbi:hypothetical protein GH714_033779 [Hevea brasiliensis]|uniref:anthocyanidin 3-O-glucosyltransferase n=1 Tax=Hevea brasiliensis TaxID=3981 RepID=A0A6A6N944_HEVBR|nr:hypothetical protein GH714_033779 [Hevea brasiliensis]